MEKSVLTIFVICLPGLLSASCSSGGGAAGTSGPGGGGGSSIGSVSSNGDPVFTDNPHHNNPHYYSSTSLQDIDASNHLLTSVDSEPRGEECKNGWCGEDGSCICNPCWSGPTCQEYVDRFAPRFLAEEPFFIVDATASGSSGYSTFLDPAFDPIYPQWPIPSSASSDFVDSSSLPSWTSPSSSPPPSSSGSGVQVQSGSGLAPLFRIESADDDLGLTCQLGQVGPPATCPCATPRYKVVGATTTFPDSLSPPKSDFSLEAHPTPLEEISKKDNSINPLVGNGKPSSPGDLLQLEDMRKSSAVVGNEMRNQSQNHNNNLFWADEETGDVFLHHGFRLQPSKHYFITLQVSGPTSSHPKLIGKPLRPTPTNKYTQAIRLSSAQLRHRGHLFCFWDCGMKFKSKADEELKKSTTRIQTNAQTTLQLGGPTSSHPPFLTCNQPRTGKPAENSQKPLSVTTNLEEGTTQLPASVSPY